MADEQMVLSEWASPKSWSQAIAVIGIPGAIAILLVYIGATTVPKILSNTEVMISEIRQNRDLLKQQNSDMGNMLRLLERTCSNAAKDDIARQRCFER